ncbi:Oligopeptide-binding protein OppA precursor [Poriferisphaera corsica]|uniref:Oligopeptide-binding protein OppA n=1 Tax=Poriferisphaera corsica TaxID=2528020 RepID=A0A517YZB1_9BACT|nr:peptide ABC transporter substrate-binding protein [Poriferisphaera corsica]QDU35557.1 Oligopeptide-binding protein OppA precursor [Poriferisphaera corsica]
MILKNALAAACAAAISISLIGCGSNTPEADVTYLSTLSHSYLDPQRMSWLHDLRVAKNMYEPLVKYNFISHKIEPAVADKWSLSEDGKTYTFHIRENAQWSNGDKITADDFVYAWRRAMLPDQAASYAELFFPIKGAHEFFTWRADQTKQFIKDNPSGSQEKADALWIQTQDQFNNNVGVKAIDPSTISIELEQPTPYFLELAAFMTYSPVHKKSVEAVTSINADTAMVITDSTYWSDSSRVIHNGPYQLKDRKFKRSILMTANPHYWNKAAMKNNSLLERIIENPETALRTFEDSRENIDLWPDVPTSGSLGEMLIEGYETGSRKEVHIMPAAATYFYNFNTIAEKTSSGEPNPLRDARVRRALSMAIDRDYIVNRVTRMKEPAATTFIPVSVIGGYNPPTNIGLKLNIEEAQKLLAEAGFPNGKDFPTLTLLYNTGSFHDKPAQAVVKMWEDNLGININLQGLEPKVFGDRLRRKDFEIARASWFGDYPDPTTFLNKLAITSNNNDTGWSNAEYNELLQQASLERDPAKRMQLLQAAENELVKDAPMALLFHFVQIRLFDDTKVKGFAEQDNPWNHFDFYKVSVER